MPEKYAIVISPAGEEWTAYAPGIPGCGASGRTIQETLNSFIGIATKRDAIFKKKSQAVPHSESFIFLYDAGEVRRFTGDNIFCNLDSNSKFAATSALIERSFDGSVPLTEWYDALRNFQMPPITVPQTALPENWSRWFTGKQCCGIDLPIWYETDADAPSIMIIGQDPFRQEKDFTLNGLDAQTEVLLGSPFAVHLGYIPLPKSPGSLGRIQKYWAFIRTIVQSSVNVYLTDLYKGFFKEGEVLSGGTTFAQDPMHLSLLREEIESIRPALIVTLGSHPAKALLGDHKHIPGSAIKELPVYNGSIPVLPLPHLSSRQGARKSQQEYLEKSGYDDANVSRAFASIVLSSISELSGHHA